MKIKGKLISACLVLSALFATGGALSLSAPVKAADENVSVTIKMNGGFRVTSTEERTWDNRGERDNRSSSKFSVDDIVQSAPVGKYELTYENIHKLFPYGAFEIYDVETRGRTEDGKATDDYLLYSVEAKKGSIYESKATFYITDEGYYCPLIVDRAQFPTALLWGLFEDSNDNGVLDDGEKAYYQGDSINLTEDITLKCFYDPLFGKGQRFSANFMGGYSRNIDGKNFDSFQDSVDRYVALDLACDVVQVSSGNYSKLGHDVYGIHDLQPFAYELRYIGRGAFKTQGSWDYAAGITGVELPNTVISVGYQAFSQRGHLQFVRGLENVEYFDDLPFYNAGANPNEKNSDMKIVFGDNIGAFYYNSDAKSRNGRLNNWTGATYIFTGFNEEKVKRDNDNKSTTPFGSNLEMNTFGNEFKENVSYTYVYVPYGETAKWYPTAENSSGFTRNYNGLHFEGISKNVPMREMYQIKFDLDGGTVNGKLYDEFMDAGAVSVKNSDGVEVNATDGTGETVINNTEKNLSLLKATKPDDPVKEGYAFVGWEDQFGYVWTEEDWSNGGKNDYDVGVITLKAKYARPIKIKFVTNSPETVADYITYENGLIKAPDDLIPVAGKNFEGWFTIDDKKWDFSTDKVGSEDITLYAKWTSAAYSVYLYDEVGSIGEEYVAEGEGKNRRFTLTYSYGDSFELPQSVCDGYTFNGWFDDEDNKIENITADDFGTFYLTAEWQAIYYKIKYELNGGKNYYDNPDYYTKSETVELQPAKKTGYAFKGWYLDENFETPIDKIENRTGDITVYAAYEVDDSVWFTITYNLNGGKNDDRNVTEFLLRDRVVLYPATKIGYTFDGWYEDAEFKTKIEAVNTTIQKNYVLYAKFTAVEKVWNITYHLNGGTNATYNAGTYIEGKGLMLYAPTLEGYKFDGWYMDKEFTEKIEKVTESDSGDIELYAKFVANEQSNGCSGALNGECILLFVFGAMLVAVRTLRKKRDD